MREPTSLAVERHSAGLFRTNIEEVRGSITTI